MDVPNRSEEVHPNTVVRVLLFTLFAAYLVAIVVPMASADTRDFHDFATYYYAGKAYAQGLNPYDLGALKAVSAGSVQFPFLYPPLTLQVFRLFALVPFETACQLFLAAKLAALLGLGLVWTRAFLERTDPAFLFFCLLAFNSPIYLDLSVGNVSMFEQLLIWLGLRQHLRGDVRGFCLAILGASLFKLTPILLLLLLFRRGVRKRELVWFLSCSGVLAASVLVTYLANAAYLEGFVANLRAVRFLGVVNPTSLTIFQYTFNGLGMTFETKFPDALAWVFYGLVVLTVLALTVRAVRRLDAAGEDRATDRHVVLLCVLAYALVLPRLPDYGYIVVLLPAYYAIRGARGGAFPWLFLLMAHQAFNIRLPGASIVYNIVLAHMPLLMAFVAWGLLLRSRERRDVLQRPSM